MRTSTKERASKKFIERFNNVVYDDSLILFALREIKKQYKEQIAHHKEHDSKESSTEIQLNRVMLKKIDEAIKQNIKINNYFDRQ